MRHVLTEVAEQAAKSSGFIKRRVKVTGSNFSQMLVLGWLGNPEATLEELCQTGVAVGLEITPQGLDQRFTKEASNFMKMELEAAIEQVIVSEPVAVPVLQRFTGVYIKDSSTVSLPEELAHLWVGCGNGQGAGNAAVKLETSLDMVSGELDGPHLVDGRTNDRVAAQAHRPLPKGSLSLADLGYWKLADLRVQAANDGYWLSRGHVSTAIFDEAETQYTLVEFLSKQEASVVDTSICLGVAERLSARLVAVRVPEEIAQQRRRKLKKQARAKGKTVSQARLELADWTIFVTNVPLSLLSVEELLVVARVRWQIELLFKLWKSHGQIDKSRSDKPFRILTELYAKLIGMIIQHWVFLISSWQFPDRSWVKAARTVRQYAICLLNTLGDPLQLESILATISRCLTVGCRITKSVKEPRTFQLLLAVD